MIPRAPSTALRALDASRAREPAPRAAACAEGTAAVQAFSAADAQISLRRLIVTAAASVRIVVRRGPI